MATEATLEIEQGSDAAFTLTVKDNNGVPIDLSGGTYASQIRTNYASASPLLADFTIDSTNAATGVFILTIDRATTAAFGVSHLDNVSDGQIRVPQWGVWDFEAVVGGLSRKYGRGSVTLIRESTK